MSSCLLVCLPSPWHVQNHWSGTRLLVTECAFVVCPCGHFYPINFPQNSKPCMPLSTKLILTRCHCQRLPRLNQQYTYTCKTRTRSPTKWELHCTGACGLFTGDVRCRRNACQASERLKPWDPRRARWNIFDEVWRTMDQKIHPKRKINSTIRTGHFSSRQGKQSFLETSPNQRPPGFRDSRRAGFLVLSILTLGELHTVRFTLKQLAYQTSANNCCRIPKCRTISYIFSERHFLVMV